MRPRRRSRRVNPAVIGCLVPIVLFVAIVAAVVPAVIDAVDEVDLPDVTVVDQDPDRPGRQGGDRSAEPPRGLSSTSLLRRGNFAPAVRRLRSAMGGGRLRYLRVEAGRIDAQVVLGDRLRSAQLTPGEDPNVFSTSAAGVAGLPTFSWSQVDPSAPRRLVGATTGRAKRPATAFNYAVLIDAAGLRWTAYVQGGAGFQSGPDGRNVVRLGG
jgi:hypothetical protein